MALTLYILGFVLMNAVANHVDPKAPRYAKLFSSAIWPVIVVITLVIKVFG
jgi:hypothetical protein